MKGWSKGRCYWTGKGVADRKGGRTGGIKEEREGRVESRNEGRKGASKVGREGASSAPWRSLTFDNPSRLCCCYCCHTPPPPAPFWSHFPCFNRTYFVLLYNTFGPQRDKEWLQKVGRCDEAVAVWDSIHARRPSFSSKCRTNL